MNIISKIIDKIKNDELDDAHQDIRDIAKVVKSQHEDSIAILSDYLDGSLPLSEAVDLAGDLNKGESVKKATSTFDKLLNEDYKFVKQLMRSDTDLTMKLKQIQNNLKGLLNIQ